MAGAGGSEAVDLQACLEVAMAAAKEAGALIAAAWNQPKLVEHKGGQAAAGRPAARGGGRTAAPYH